MECRRDENDREDRARALCIGGDDREEHSVDREAERAHDDLGEDVADHASEERAECPSDVGDHRESEEEDGRDLLLTRGNGEDLVGHEEAEEKALHAAERGSGLLREGN